MCRCLEGVKTLTHAKWVRWDFEMDDDNNNENNDDTQGRNIIYYDYH
jgi:hypothetical protein